MKNSVLNSDRYTYDYFCLEYVCRLCWNTDGVEELTSYTPNSMQNDGTIAQKILECIDVDVTTHSFPKKVCTKCVSKVEVFIKFKRFCQQTNEKLHNILQNSSAQQNMIQPKTEKKYDSMTSKEETDLLHKIQLLETQFEENIDKAINLKKGDYIKYSNIKPYNLDQDYGDLSVNLPKTKQSCELGGKFGVKSKLNCSSCNINFKSVEKLTEHSVKCHGLEENGFFKCFGCSKRFKDLNLRQLHQSRTCLSCLTVLPDKVYKCRRCPETFKSAQNLKEHKQKHKTSCICEVCGKVYSSRGNLYIHKLRHEKVKQFKCPHCEFRSAQPSSLVVHIRRHTGERPYACDICPQRCVNSSNLIKHRKQHFNIKEFECEICKKQFRQKISLKDHIISVHQKAKTHSCPHCGLLYSLFRNLRVHLLVKHGKRVKKCRDELIEVASGVVYKRQWKKKTQDESDLKEGSFEVQNTGGR